MSIERQAGVSVRVLWILKVIHGPVLDEKMMPPLHRLWIEVDTQAGALGNANGVVGLSERSIFDDIPDLPAEKGLRRLVTQ